MNGYNSREGYGIIAIVLHWLSAMVAFGLFGSGVWMVDLDYYHSWYHQAPMLHKSVGMLLFLVTLVRFLWFLFNVKPDPLSPKPIEQFAAIWMHRLLYAIIFCVMISGYLIPTADGAPVDVFTFISVPAILAQGEKQEELASDAHELLAYFFAGLVLLHLLAALKHHFWNRDRTLIRMLKTTRSTK